MINLLPWPQKRGSVESPFLAFVTLFAIVSLLFPIGPVFANELPLMEAELPLDSANSDPTPIDPLPKPGSSGNYTPIDPTPSGGGGSWTPAVISPSAIPSPSASLGTISGSVFNDLDGSYSFTAGEPGIEGWSVELYLFNPLVDAAPLATQITDASGNYTFSDLPLGIYVVRQIQKPPRWIQTFPHGPLPIDPAHVSLPPEVIPYPINPVPVPVTHALTDESHPATGTSYKVTLGAGQTVGNLKFGNFGYAVVSGTVWHDLNADGIWQLAGTYPEPAISSVNIVATGAFTKQTSTLQNGTYQHTFGPNELGNWSFSEAIGTDWRHTYPANPATYSLNLTLSGQSETDRNFGIVHYYDVAGIKFVPLSGNPSATPHAFALDTETTSIATNGGQTAITVGANTTFTRADGQPFGVYAFAGDAVALSSLGGLPAEKIARVAIQWGIPGVELLMQTPVQFELFVGTGFDGRTLEVFRATTGTGGWSSDGIVAARTCVVTAGICSFSTTRASYFVAAETVATTPPPPPPPSNGGPSGGGTGSGSVTTPIPPPPPPGTNSGTLPPLSPPPQSSLVTFVNPPSQSPRSNDVVVEGTDPLQGTETGTESEGVELEPSPNEESEAAPDENGGFLGAIGNLLTLGTGNMLLGWLVALAILALIFYAFRRFREREATARVNE